VATKRPFANYAGILKEIQTGDLLLGGGTASPDAVRQNLQRLMLETAVLGNYPAGVMPYGVFDIFQDESGVDTVNSVANYGAELYTPIECIGTQETGAYDISSGITFVERNVQLPNGRTILKIGVYNLTTTGTIKFKLAETDGVWDYVLTDIESFSLGGPGGYQEFTLTTPLVIPSAEHDYFLAYYCSATADNLRVASTATIYYGSGDLTGSQELANTIANSDVQTCVILDPIEEDNMILISDPTAIPIIPSSAAATLFVKNKDASTKVYFSTASTPSWTELTGLTLIAENVDGTGVDQYSTGSVSVSGSSDKQARWKVETDAGNDTELHGVAIRYE